MIAAFIAAIRSPDRMPDADWKEDGWSLLTTPDGPVDAASVADGPIDAPTRTAIVAAMQPLSGDAETLVRSAPSLYRALGIAFNDKSFKAAFRDYGARKGCSGAVSRAIREGCDLAEGIAPPISSSAGKRTASAPVTTPRTISPRAAPARVSSVPRVGAVRAPVRPPVPATSVLIDKIPWLRRYASSSVLIKTAGTGRSTTNFLDALAMLEDSGLEKQHAAILQGIGASPARLSILLIDRAIGRGVVSLPDATVLKIGMSAIRLFSNLNGSQTSYDRATGLAASPLAVQLSEGERIRLRFYIARAALRSGRGTEAQDAYRQLFLDHPTRADAAMQYVMSIFATKPDAASALAAAILDNGYDISASDRIFLGEICLRAGDRARATGAFLQVAAGVSLVPDAYLGLANAALVAGEEDDWFAYLRRYGSMRGLDLSSLKAPAAHAPFRFATPDYPRRTDHPRIAVVMTSFNAEATLAQAVESVMAQTLANIELWIVDDCSSDGSAALASSLAQGDDRIRAIRNTANMGTYASKNSALRMTDAHYVTLHDSDDWMHPRKLEHQLAALGGNRACSISDWIRMDGDGKTYVRRGGPYSHLNPASTFFARSLLDDVGYFDTVRTGADAEFLLRMRTRVGWENVVDTGKCLAVGLHHEASLTTSGATAFDEHRYSPVRLAYTESWLSWHLDQIEQGTDPRVTDTGDRPFVAPDAIR